ncbi:MAG TPA: plastocyanin/azurin family copper-binding protein [Methylomirabilota bacterium]|jgi:plastocyanin|nr:plastocyanin/azurin family copper-binding protein [Methylomirabilota bacterium]
MMNVVKLELTLALLGGAALAALAVLSATADSKPGVTVQLFQFRPSPLAVPAGAPVTWLNQDDITHTITSGTPEKRDGRFNLQLAGKGATGTVEFTDAGVYPYFCDRHQSMRGEIRVN